MINLFSISTPKKETVINGNLSFNICRFIKFEMEKNDLATKTSWSKPVNNWKYLYNNNGKIEMTTKTTIEITIILIFFLNS